MMLLDGFTVLVFHVFVLLMPVIAESTEAKFQLTLNIKTTLNFRPVRNCRLQVEFVTSLLTALRQWVGLMHLSKSLLACDILRPRKTDYFCSNDYHQSSHVAKVLFSYVSCLFVPLSQTFKTC